MVHGATEWEGKRLALTLYMHRLVMKHGLISRSAEMAARPADAHVEAANHLLGLVKCGMSLNCGSLAPPTVDVDVCAGLNHTPSGTLLPSIGHGVADTVEWSPEVPSSSVDEAEWLPDMPSCVPVADGFCTGAGSDAPSPPAAVPVVDVKWRLPRSFVAQPAQYSVDV